MKKKLLLIILGSLVVAGIAAAVLIPLILKKDHHENPVPITPSPEPQDSAGTALQIFNRYDSAVVVYITLGATPGCIQSVLDLPFNVDTVPGSKEMQGTFVLAPGDSTVAFNSDTLGFNGVISFGYAPDNCPSPRYPLGLNQFEFILNNSFQPGQPQESINISCVHGVNCVIRCDVKTDSLTPFNAGPTIPLVQGFANTLNRSQINIVGVYPYGCTHCTDYIGAPNCIPVPQPVNTEAICQVQRPAVKTNKGKISVIYLGTLQPAVK